jgi:phospholipid/cholesterol/gamma-HCH transport system substrate-binding protein
MQDERRLTDVRVGIFVLAALTILVVGSLWIAGSAFLAPRKVSYEILLDDSGGIEAGDRVRVAGVAVGKVRQVVLRPEDEWPVRFVVGVRKSVPIRTDGSAKIASAGLMGNSFLQIDPGTATEPLLPPGGEIYGKSRMGFDRAMEQVDRLGDKAVVLLEKASTLIDQVSGELTPIMTNLQALLSEENAANVASLLETLDDTMSDAGPKLTSLITRLESVAESAEGGAQRLPELTAKLERLLDDLRGATGPDGARLSGLLDTAQSSLSSADDALSIFTDSRDELEATMRDLRDTVANLKAFSQTVKERPFSLVRVKSEPERDPGDGVK